MIGGEKKEMGEEKVEKEFRKVKNRAIATQKLQSFFDYGGMIVTAIVFPSGIVDGYDGDGNRWENI